MLWVFLSDFCCSFFLIPDSTSLIRHPRSGFPVMISKRYQSAPKNWATRRAQSSIVA